MYLWIGCWEEKNKNENNERPAKGKLMARRSSHGGKQPDE